MTRSDTNGAGGNDPGAGEATAAGAAGAVFEVALTVESLRQAENLYTALFGLRVAGRDRGGDGGAGGESGGGEGGGDSCPADGVGVGPDDDPRRDFRRSLLTSGGVGAAAAAADNVCGGLRLLLLRGYVETAAATPASGRVAHVGLTVCAEAAARVRACAESLGCRILADGGGDGALVVEDPLGVRWRLSVAR